jgi:calcium/calmodulin-dependent protein kinase (CaM kinase) II
MAEGQETELLRLNQRLLDSIAGGDWATYQELCDPTLTALEPESHNLLAEGMDFHHFYFKLGGFNDRHLTTMVRPHVRIMGDVAVLAYVRLVQRVGSDGVPMTVASAETRVWQRREGRWRHVHFHRTKLA